MLTHRAALPCIRDEVRREVDRPVAVVGPAGLRSHHVQPRPRHTVEVRHPRGARSRMPCAPQVARIPHSECGVARTHQLLTRRRQLTINDERPTTRSETRLALETTTWAQVTSIHGPDDRRSKRGARPGSLTRMTAHVALFFLGGTISMSSSSGTAVQPTLGADELLAAIPGLDAADIRLTGETIAREQSGSLTFQHILDVLRRARAVQADGFVLVQGTDTLEESAYLIDLLWDDERPFVVTGAMRNPTMAGADGSANILAAVRVAASSAARGRGCLVAFADEIHAAEYVTKSDTASVATFISPDTGPVGRVLEGFVHFFHGPRRHPALPTPETVDVEVPLVLVGFGQSARAITSLAATADAIVIAGFGAGHVPGWWAETMTEIASTIPVVMTSRTTSGPALVETYGAVGAEVDLQERGVVMGGYLSAVKARLLICVMLAGKAERPEIERAVTARGGYR